MKLFHIFSVVLDKLSKNVNYKIINYYAVFFPREKETLCVVNVDQRLVAVNSKRLSKSAFSKFFVPKAEKRKKKQDN